MTKLRDLDAIFIGHTSNGNFNEVQTIAEASGVMFDCPKCLSHSVLLWDRSIPAFVSPGPGRWTLSGTGIDDLTANPSVNLPHGCKWHGWVKNGDAQ